MKRSKDDGQKGLERAAKAKTKDGRSGKVEFATAEDKAEFEKGMKAYWESLEDQ
jgi:hypothetical protein